MAFKRKCKYCGEFILDENDAIEYKNGYVHSKCFSVALKVVQEKRVENVVQKSRKASPKTESVKIPKRGLTEEEHEQKTAYFNYIREQLNGELPAKVFAVTEKYIEQYKDKAGTQWSYPNMQLTLKYCKEILQKELTDDCVGLIRFYYDEAVEFYEHLSKLKANVASSMSNINSSPTNLVKINPRAKKNVKQINIEEIGVNDYED